MLFKVLIRRFKNDDTSNVISVFEDAIMNIASQDYNEEQCRAWSQYGQDHDRFQAALQEGITLVAEDEHGIVAYGQLHPADHVNYLYCRARGKGKGCATRILANLESEASRQGVHSLYTEASLTARSFFEKNGYEVLEQEIVSRNGIKLPRFKMKKLLASS